MLKKKIEEALVQQIEKEAFSSNLYLAMACWAENNGFKGVSQWLYAQAEEEHMHMLKFVKYVNERGGQAIISAIEKPESQFQSVSQLFDEVLKHEQYVSQSINNIVELCLQEKDHTTFTWIQWFVNEQIEEESSVQEIIDKLKLVGTQNLYIFDRDIMASRNATAE